MTTLVLANGCKPASPGIPDPHTDPEVLVMRHDLGPDALSAGEESGVQDGRIVDPELGMVIHDLQGDDCATSLVFYGPWMPFARDGAYLTSIPFSIGTPTLADPAVETSGYGYANGASFYRYQGGTFTLNPQGERTPFEWHADVDIEALCAAANALAEPTCAPPEQRPRLTFSVWHEGNAQVDGADVLPFFDVVPSPDWTFQDVALPPCVPRRRP